MVYVDIEDPEILKASNTGKQKLEAAGVKVVITRS